MSPRLWSERSKILYFISVWEKRIRTLVQWSFGREKWCTRFEEKPFLRRVKKHQSLLLRKLGESEMQLQYNKITNLKIAIGRINNILIRPGETFSFCRTVGRPTKGKGYLEGMELAHGEARPGVGGGICQISNLIHWLVMHSPLTIVERHHHGFDPFPDDRRVLPFGSGATIFYNYVDYRFRNDTEHTFQIRLWLSEKHLHGELRADSWMEHAYHIYEKEHSFIRENGKYFRCNEIWRRVMVASGGNTVRDELVCRNHAEVKYVPEVFRDTTPV